MEYLELVTTQIVGVDVENTINNVFYFRSDSGVGNPNTYAAGLINAFLSYETDPGVSESILAVAINQIQAAGAQNVRVNARNLYNDLDFAEQTWAGGGFFPGNTAPQTVAVSFRSARYRTGRNRARKRFGMLSEDQIGGDNINTATGYADAMSALGSALGSTLTGTDGQDQRQYVPIVLYRVRVESEGNVGYRLPLTSMEADGLHDDATTWQWSTTTATQNSRRGAPNYVT